jgi:hypothetical protein
MWKILLMVMTNIVITLAFASAQVVYYGNTPNNSGQSVTYTDATGNLVGTSYRSGNIVTFTDKNGALVGSGIINEPPPPSVLSEHYLDGE